ncbi:MAG: hypothetical protein HC906_02950 [Bacteroidales bacterium]|nr:hypothetical protein [Bacteroidales bacterium]
MFMYREFRNKLISYGKSRVIVLTLLIGFLFPVLSWIIHIVINKVPVTPGTIFQIHNNNPVLYLIDLIPFFLFGLSFYLIDQRESEKLNFAHQIKERDIRLSKMAEFAKQIGEGNYTIDLDISDNNDILGHSLILMRDNLLANYQKESEQSWIAEGKDIVSNLLRLHNKIDDLSNEVLKALINTLG